MKKILLVVMSLALSFSMSFAKTALATGDGTEASIVGQWDFEDSTDFGKATIGSDLELFGSYSVVEGPTQGSIAMLLGNGDYLKATTNIIPQGEGVNTYTLRMDIKMDALGWSSLIQTNISNGNDEIYYW